MSAPHRTKQRITIDYALVLAIINSDDHPAVALESFVKQEREAALESAGVVVLSAKQYAELTAED